jgi:hypothetical protein
MQIGSFLRKSGLGFMLATFWVPTPRAVAQQTAGPAAPTTEQLMQRIEELEARLKAVENKDASKQAPASVPSPAAQAPAPAANALTAAEQAELDAIQQQANNNNAAGHEFGKINFLGITDFSFGRPYEDNLPPQGLNGASYSFSMGDLDLFMSSQLSPKLSFFAELLITSDFTNEWSAEIDRAMLQYKANQYFQIGFGRYNTALGYYTNAINRASIFQTATGRPFMYADEDAGGILPVHGVGVTMTGLVPSGPVGLHWVAELSNGMSLAAGTEPVQSFYDSDNRKAYNLGLFVKPEKPDGFQAGVSVYQDHVSLGGGAPTVDQIITGAYAVWVRPQFEFLNEVALMNNSPVNSSRTYETFLGYTQISHRMGHYRPYLRAEYQAVPSADPLFAGQGVRRSAEFGVRRDLGEYFAIKGQLGRTWWHGVWAWEPQIQLAFMF